MRRALRLSLALLLLPAAASGRQAADPRAARQQAEEAERAHAASVAAQAEAAARAAKADEAARALADQRVAAAARLREAEGRTAEIASRMDGLARRAAEAERTLAERADDLAPMLPVIERLSLYPAETMLAVPGSPDDSLRGLLVLRGLSAELERQAGDLRREEAEIAAARAGIEAEAPRLRAARDAQAEQAASLDRAIAAARRSGEAARSDVAEAAERAQAEAARADSLKAVVARLDAQRAADEARAAADAARAERQSRPVAAADARLRQAALSAPPPSSGRMTAPVAGAVVRAWGEETDAGPASGVSYRAAPQARVVSPCAGRAVFAAPFRSYGLLVIVDCGGGTHVVLGGLDRLDVRAGEALRAGEPVGAMGDWDPSRSGARPSLYVELRRAGQAVNPAPYLSGQG